MLLLENSFNVTLFNNNVNCWAELCRIDKCRSNGLHFEFMLFSNMDFKLPADCPPWNWPFKQKSSLALEPSCNLFILQFIDLAKYRTGFIHYCTVTVLQITWPVFFHPGKTVMQLSLLDSSAIITTRSPSGSSGFAPKSEPHLSNKIRAPLFCFPRCCRAGAVRIQTESDKNKPSHHGWNGIYYCGSELQSI